MEDRALLSGESQEEEREGEERIRPHSLKDFQGQEALKENLSIFIQAARQRDEPLDHLFINGPPGLGKTTLSGILAHELGVPIKITSAPALDKPKDLAGLLTTIAPKTFFFVDEIHRLKPAIEEMLYTAMEDFELDWVVGQGPAARTIRIPLPPFTMVGATTRPGKVASPLHARFGITVKVDFYTEKELERVLERSSKIYGTSLEEQARQKLARCSRGTPRVANRLLRRMRDFAQVRGTVAVTLPLVNEGLQRLEIDTYGLDKTDRDILRTIILKYEGGPVGVETLAISVGEGSDSLEDFYEPFLIQRGLLKRTPRGRVTTPLAYQHLGLTRKGDEEEQFLL